MLSDTLLRELYQILKEDFGKELKRDELVQTANSLVGLFEVLVKINEEIKNKNDNKYTKEN